MLDHTHFSEIAKIVGAEINIHTHTDRQADAQCQNVFG